MSPAKGCHALSKRFWTLSANSSELVFHARIPQGIFLDQVKLPALLLLFVATAFPAEVKVHELPHRLPRLISVFPQGARPGTSLHADSRRISRPPLVCFVSRRIHF